MNPNGTLAKITGWHLEMNKMKKVEVYINDQLQLPLTSSINQLRNDVYNLYPEYSNKNSGYRVEIKSPGIRLYMNLPCID